MARPLPPTVAAMAANTPMGAKRITSPVKRNITCATPSKNSVTARPRSPRVASDTPKNVAKMTTWRMSPRAIASKTEVGNMWSTMSQPDCWRWAMAARSAAVSVTTCTPAPGWNRLTSVRPRISEITAPIWKYTIALRPMRPIAFTSPVPAMPTTSVENRRGAMIILIIRRNMSASGLMLVATSGATAPSSTPRARPMKIWMVRLGMGSGLAGAGWGSGLAQACR